MQNYSGFVLWLINHLKIKADRYRAAIHGPHPNHHRGRQSDRDRLNWTCKGRSIEENEGIFCATDQGQAFIVAVGSHSCNFVLAIFKRGFIYYNIQS